MVINLINNACQSLKNTSAGITVSTYYNKTRNKVRIKVEDQGIGIKEGDLKYIMDPFFTTKREMGGTGLGLSVSYSIVKSHKAFLFSTVDLKKGQPRKHRFLRYRKPKRSHFNELEDFPGQPYPSCRR